MAATTSVSVKHLSGPAMANMFRAITQSQSQYPNVRDLTTRELEVMRAFLSPVADNTTVAQNLSISSFTLNNHLKNVFSKLGVDNLKKAVWRFVLIYSEFLPEFLQFYSSAAETTNAA